MRKQISGNYVFIVFSQGLSFKVSLQLIRKFILLYNYEADQICCFYGVAAAAVVVVLVFVVRDAKKFH